MTLAHPTGTPLGKTWMSGCPEHSCRDKAMPATLPPGNRERDVKQEALCLVELLSQYTERKTFKLQNEGIRFSFYLSLSGRNIELMNPNVLRQYTWCGAEAKHSHIDRKNCFQMRNILSQSHQTQWCQLLTWWSSSSSPGCSQGVSELLPIGIQRRTGFCAVTDWYPQTRSTWEAPMQWTVTQRWTSGKLRMAVDLSAVAAGSTLHQTTGGDAEEEGYEDITCTTNTLLQWSYSVNIPDTGKVYSHATSPLDNTGGIIFSF